MRDNYQQLKARTIIITMLLFERVILSNACEPAHNTRLMPTK